MSMKCYNESMKTKRANLRRPVTSDLDNYQALESDADIVCWTPMATPRTRDQSLERLMSHIDSNGDDPILGYWIAETIYGKDFIGWFTLLELQPRSPVLGFMIVKDQWRRGWATEICKSLITEVFHRTDSVEILATTNKDNERSQNVLSKLGFYFAGTESQIDSEENEIFIKKISFTQAMT